MCSIACRSSRAKPIGNKGRYVRTVFSANQERLGGIAGAIPVGRANLARMPLADLLADDFSILNYRATIDFGMFRG